MSQVIRIEENQLKRIGHLKVASMTAQYLLTIVLLFTADRSIITIRSIQRLSYSLMEARRKCSQIIPCSTFRLETIRHFSSHTPDAFLQFRCRIKPRRAFSPSSQISIDLRDRLDKSRALILPQANCLCLRNRSIYGQLLRSISAIKDRNYDYLLTT